MAGVVEGSFASGEQASFGPASINGATLEIALSPKENAEASA